jgi:hypothetical protein
MNMEISAEERRERWGETFVNEECYDWDYGQWIVEALDSHLAAVENIVGADAVSEPFKDLLREAMNIEGYDPMPWRKALENVGPGAWTAWEMGECFRELGLYGRFGVTDADIPVKDREGRIEDLLMRAEVFIKESGFDQPGDAGGQPLKIVRLARSRRSLDKGIGDVDPGSLAIFGGWSEGRVRNMMSGADRVFENTGGQVPAVSAMDVLKDRPAFFDSLWSAADDEPSKADKHFQDARFVPVARDGSIFHPGLTRGGSYTIGAKGDEVTLATFEEALAALHLMSNPAWRRPNAIGNWGLVKGVEWTRMDRADLEKMGR